LLAKPDDCADDKKYYADTDSSQHATDYVFHITLLPFLSANKGKKLSADLTFQLRYVIVKIVHFEVMASNMEFSMMVMFQ